MRMNYDNCQPLNLRIPFLALMDEDRCAFAEKKTETFSM